MDCLARAKKAAARLRAWAASVVSGAEIKKLQDQLAQKDVEIAEQQAQTEAVTAEIEAVADELAGPETPPAQDQQQQQHAAAE